MKVIIVTDYAFVNGGAGKVALESAVALAEHVDHVHIFAAVGEVPAAFKMVPNLTATSLGQKKVTELPAIQGASRGLWNREALTKFDELLAQYDPADTVIHIHSWRDALTLSVAVPAQKRGFKIAITGHDYGLACPMGGFFDYKSMAPCGHKAMSVPCLRSRCTGGSFAKKSWFVARHSLQPLRAKMPQHLKHFIAVGQLSADVLKPYLPDTTRIHYLANPIPIQKASRITAEKNEGYVFLGRLSQEKAPVLAAQAARRLEVPIAFVGSGPLEDTVRSANPDAEMLGWRSNEEVGQILASKRALIFPSVWYEGQPLVIDEAAAMGLPVICSDVSAGANAVKQRNAGSVFRSGDIEALMRRMNEFQFDEIVESYSKSGYESYWSHPQTVERHLRELLEIYSEVLAG